MPSYICMYITRRYKSAKRRCNASINRNNSGPYEVLYYGDCVTVICDSPHICGHLQNALRATLRVALLAALSVCIFHFRHLQIVCNTLRRVFLTCVSLNRLIRADIMLLDSITKRFSRRIIESNVNSGSGARPRAMLLNTNEV